MDNIILIGMPGCGKSTIGVQLARQTGYSFIDTDILIQEQEGKLIDDLIESVGLWGFGKIEEDLTAGIEAEHTVIATGGSIIYGEKAMNHLDKIGTIVYIYLPTAELETRLEEEDKSSIAAEGEKNVESLYNERKDLYEKYADITVDVTGMSNREAARKIIGVLKERGVL